ncbi:MAG: glycosyltransferase [Chloroflexi bacterium]|nr:MAG: glycosyltransferase [Chloroflexota bacterium]
MSRKNGVKVSIVTDFTGYDPAYSLCQSVRAQAWGLKQAGCHVRIITRQLFEASLLNADEIVQVDMPHGGNEFDPSIAGDSDINRLATSLMLALEGSHLVITHDVFYQPSCWPLRLALYRIHDKIGGEFVHYIHSETLWEWDKGNPVLNEVRPFGYLVAFHHEQIERRARQFSWPEKDIVVIPNALNLYADVDPLVTEITSGIWSGIILLAVCRLDGGKQPEIVAEIAHALNYLGYSAVAIIVDFHSLDTEKQRRKQAINRITPHVRFMSDYDERGSWPPSVIRDLMRFADVVVHPSRLEADGMVVAEAMAQRIPVVLNRDLLRWHEFLGKAIFGQFSANIDALTGQHGETTTNYSNRTEYMRQIALRVLQKLTQNPLSSLAWNMRCKRHPLAVAYQLLSLIKG